MQLEIYLFFSFFILLLASFFIAQSYYLYFWYRKNFGYSALFEQLQNELNATYSQSGYFAQGSKIITPHAYKNLSNRYKIQYTQCYNILKFKTKDTSWEVFLYLVKEGFVYNEILIVRAFPSNKIISKEASIERIRGQISIFSNSRYLSEILEEKEMLSKFEWLVRNDSDSFLLLSNNIMFKAFSDNKVMNSQKIFNILKVIQNVKKRVFDKDTLKF